MNRDQERAASLEALQTGWQHDGGERTDHLLTALTHAVLAISAPAPAAPTDYEGKRLRELLDSIRELGGQWNSKRAQDRFAYLGETIYSDMAKQYLRRLMQGGYLTEVEKGVYELTTAPVRIQSSTGDA